MPAIQSGQHDAGSGLGFDKHARGAFDEQPRNWGLPDWYGAAGFMLTTQYFAMKIQRYMSLHGISRGRSRSLPRRPIRMARWLPHAWRKQP